MGLFRTRAIISAEDLEFQLETFKWLIKYFPSRYSENSVRLVLPNRVCFPHVGSSIEERVNDLFQHVRRLAGMQDWPCVLEPQEVDPNPHVAPTVLVKDSPQGPAGTFRIDEDNKARITFNINQVHDNWALVATFAHELAHYLTCTAKSPPPGGWDNWEFATDLAAIYLGFGVFLANSSFTFQQYQGVSFQGWSSRRRGYLSENEIVFALAIFVLLFDVNEKVPLKHLKDALKGRYKKALKYLKENNLVMEIAGSEPSATAN